MKTIHRDRSLAKDLLIALIPYTKQNLQLVFIPNQFFNNFEQNHGVPKHKILKTYNRFKKDQVIAVSDNDIKISLKGRQIIEPFIATKLANDAQLMVIFDIPEDLADRRRRFRYLLRQLDFKQIQQSVWMSDKNHKNIIFESIAEIEIQEYVQLYEASRIIKT